MNLFCSTEGRSAQRHSFFIPDCSAKNSHNLEGNPKEFLLMIFCEAFVFLNSWNLFLRVSSLYSGNQFTLIPNSQFLSFSSRAPHALNLNTAGPLNPQCVISIGPSSSSFVRKDSFGEFLILTFAFSILTPINFVIG